MDIKQWEREEAARLNADRLPAARSDEAAAITSQADQARLVVFGSLGAVAVSVTAMLATDRALCRPFLDLAFVLLMLAAIAGWTAHSLVAAAWDLRSVVTRKDLAMMIASVNGEPTDQPKQEFTSALLDLSKMRSRIRIMIGVGAVLGWWAAPALIAALWETQRGQCSVSVMAAFGAWVSEHVALLPGIMTKITNK